MTNIIAFATRDSRQDREPAPDARPVMTWVIDPASGRPVVAWSLPQPVPGAEVRGTEAAAA